MTMDAGRARPETVADVAEACEKAGLADFSYRQLVKLTDALLNLFPGMEAAPKVKPAYSSWSPEEDAVVRAEVGRGRSYREIGVMLGRGHRSVSNRVARLGIRRGEPEVVS